VLLGYVPQSHSRTMRELKPLIIFQANYKLSSLTCSKHGLLVKSESVNTRYVLFDCMLAVLRRVYHSHAKDEDRKRKLILLVSLLGVFRILDY
jgi:hypothetical protein